jgi:PKD repeat protein
VGTSVASGQSVTFTAANSTNPDGFALVYTWVFSNGQANATGQSVAVVMSGTGTVTATLQVRNSVGMLASGVAPTRAVTVTGGSGNQPPVATVGAPVSNVSIAAGGTVNFQGSGTDPNNNLPLTYQWVLTGGTPASSTAQNPGTVTYTTAGTFTASFTVIDSLGLASAAVSRTVTVTGGTGNQPPVATVSAPASNVSIAAGGTVNFQGSGTDPNGNLPLTYQWVFAGGSPASSTAQNPGAITYSTTGTFTASFTVVDSLGLASTAVTRTVTVGTASQIPTASIDVPTINVSVLPGGGVTFRGSGVSPTNQLPLTYRWTFAGGNPSSSTSQNPGTVRFNTVGKFTVTLVVTDSARRRSVAAIREITVAAANQRAPSLKCRSQTESDDDEEEHDDC